MNIPMYIFLIFLALIFFTYGLLLSEMIDYVFPSYDELTNDFRLAIELIGEIAVAYLIYFSFKYHIDKIVLLLFQNISKSPPSYLNQLLLISFSLGIFRHLQKITSKMLYFRKKFANPILEKIPYCEHLLVS
jgi:hypothetical protein